MRPQQPCRTHIDRRLRQFGLRDCPEVVDLVDELASLEHKVEYGGGAGGDGGMAPQAKLDSLRAGIRKLLGVPWEEGGDLFVARGETQADRVRAVLREGHD